MPPRRQMREARCAAEPVWPLQVADVVAVEMHTGLASEGAGAARCAMPPARLLQLADVVSVEMHAGLSSECAGASSRWSSTMSILSRQGPILPRSDLEVRPQPG